MTGIIAFLTGLFETIKLIAKAFYKSPNDKLEDDKAKIRDEMDKFKDTGRPK